MFSHFRQLTTRARARVLAYHTESTSSKPPQVAENERLLRVNEHLPSEMNFFKKERPKEEEEGRHFLTPPQIHLLLYVPKDQRVLKQLPSAIGSRIPA